MKSFLNYMLKRTVFANTVMILIIIGGLLSTMSIRQENLPIQEARKVEISVCLSGASPNEINTTILLPIENEVRGLDGIKHVDGKATEGNGTVTVSLLENVEMQEVVSNIKTAVDRIDTFPEDADKPVITIPSHVEKALSIVIYGDQPFTWLQQTAETVRDDLRTIKDLKKVEIAFPRDREIVVEISDAALRQHQLTLKDVAGKIHANSSNLPGGTLLTKEADIGLRTCQLRANPEDFGNVVIKQTDNGTPVRLAELAELKNGFGESPVECWFNGLPAIQLDVFAVGNESPLSVEEAVNEYLESDTRKQIQGVEMVIFENQASAYRSRMNLLVENSLLGLILVLVTLGLFLSPNVAFWVMAGIPTSLLGGILLLPLFGATINMLSLFAFIVTIGVVVDDAIMIGEAIHTNRLKGMTNFEAAVQGLKEMGGPVLLATMTTIIAFTPMFFVPGESGILFYQIPAVVVAVLLVSLLESLFILAAHISTDESEKEWLKFLARPQRVVNQRLENFIEYKFRPFINESLKRPASLYVSAVFSLIITIAAISGGWLGFSFTPTIDSDMIIAQAALPYGSPKQKSVEIQKRLVDSANQVLKDNSMKSHGVFSLIGLRLEEGEVEVETLSGYHYISVLMLLPKEEERTISGRQFAGEWREAFGESGALEALNFTSETNVSGGEPIMLEVFHPNSDIAKKAAISLGDKMRILSGLTSIDDGVRAGKPELNLKMKDLGIQMGITAEMLAEQVRHRYYGIEARKLIKGSNEIKVMVRLSENERNGLGALYDTRIQNTSGELIPLTEIAEIEQKLSFTSLVRRNGKRIYPVTADIGFGISDDMIEDALEDVIVPQILSEYQGVAINFGGEEEEEDESLGYLGKGFLVVLGIIFLMLVFHYNSCTQALIVLTAVPFSIVGAVWGHILLGHDLSIISVIGIIAMAGVVVNDSLVLVTTYNRYRNSGESKIDAIVDAVCHRFRPIFLTTLTTFIGLVPLLLETSEQAQFLIPAAISISFGLLFGTLITLVLMPGLLWLFEKEEEETLTLALNRE